jgi:hypothetical protein
MKRSDSLVAAHQQGRRNGMDINTASLKDLEWYECSDESFVGQIAASLNKKK